MRCARAAVFTLLAVCADAVKPWCKRADVETPGGLIYDNYNLDGCISLDLQEVGAAFGDAGAASLAAQLKGNSALKLVYLGFNEIGDEGAIAIANLLRDDGASALATLNLPFNKITEKGVVALADALEHNTVTTQVELNGNPEPPMSDAGKRLQSVLDKQKSRGAARGVAAEKAIRDEL